MGERLGPGRHLVVLGHGLAAAALARLLARWSWPPGHGRPPLSAAVLVSPPPPLADGAERREALAAVAAAASDADLCQRLLFSPGAAEEDVAGCVRELRLGLPLQREAEARGDGHGPLPWREACSEAGLLLSDRTSAQTRANPRARRRGLELEQAHAQETSGARDRAW